MADRTGKAQEKPLARKVNDNYPATRNKADAMQIPPYEGQYEEMLDIVAVQDKRLLQEDDKIEFLKSLMPHGQETFGFKNLETRKKEPSMNEIFSYGYEAPVKNDYTKNKAEISNKIRKMKRAYISESHDNYRKPQGVDDQYDEQDVNQHYLFNYFDSDEIELFKRKLFEKANIQEREIRNKSMYKEFFGSLEAYRSKLREIKTWSSAGQKAPVPECKRKLDPNLDQKQGELWLFGNRPEYLNDPGKQKLGVD